MEGWIKLHRKLSEKAFYRKDSSMVHLWIHLLICANHAEREEYFAGKKIICNPGQFTTGRKQLSVATGINESKIERILLKLAKIEQQIEQQKSSTNRLISILNWKEYQESEQPFEQQVNNDRTTSEHTPRIKELKNEKNSLVAAISSTAEREKLFYNSLIPFVERHGKDRLKSFYNYWTEKNKSGTKMRFELEKTWELSKRLTTWENREKINGKPKQEIKETIYKQLQ